MKSRVHPKYIIWKHCFQVYRVSNWAEYDRALVESSDITLWISEGRKRSFRVIASWKPAPTGRRGAQRKFSDHTTLSRHSQHLGIQLARVSTKKPIHLIVDSTELSIVGEGGWVAAKYGRRGKRAWIDGPIKLVWIAPIAWMGGSNRRSDQLSAKEAILLLMS